MRRWGSLAVAAALLALGPAPALADAARVAYVDEVAVFGGPEPSAGRGFVGAVLREAGLAPSFAPAGRAPCGDDSACLAERARRAGAEVAARATIVEAAGSVSAALLVVRADGRGWRYRKEGVDLGGADAEIAAALASSPLLAREEGGADVAAWSFTGASVLLTAGGALSLWRAYDLRREFLDEHVDASGDVVGISPEDARAAERRAQSWSLAGSLLLGAGVASGVTAGVLFVRDSGERRARPAGVVVAGEF